MIAKVRPVSHLVSRAAIAALLMLALLFLPAPAVSAQEGDLPLVEITAYQTTANEGDDVVFTLTRSVNLTGSLDVQLEISENTQAISPGVPRTMVVRLDAEQATTTVTFGILEGDGDEEDGSLTLAIIPQDDYAVDANNSSATTAILDTDPLPTLALSYRLDDGDSVLTPISSDTLYVDERAGQFHVHAELADNAVSRRYASVRATGDHGTTGVHDVIYSRQTIVPHQARQQSDKDNFAVYATKEDRTREGDESFSVTFDSPYNLLLPNGEGGEEGTYILTVVIRDNDVPEVAIAADQASVAEGEPASFTLTRSRFTDRVITVRLEIDDPGSILSGNAEDLATSSEEFAAGVETVTVSLPTTDDTLDMDNSVVTVSLLPPTGADVLYRFDPPGSASVTVRDDDDAPELELVADNTTVEEGDTLTFTLNRPRRYSQRRARTGQHCSRRRDCGHVVHHRGGANRPVHTADAGGKRR